MGAGVVKVLGYGTAYSPLAQAQKMAGDPVNVVFTLGRSDWGNLDSNGSLATPLQHCLSFPVGRDPPPSDEMDTSTRPDSTTRPRFGLPASGPCSGYKLIDVVTAVASWKRFQGLISAVREAQRSTNEYLSSILEKEEATKRNRQPKSGQKRHQNGSFVSQPSSSRKKSEAGGQMQTERKRCPHGAEYSKQDCVWSPTHWTKEVLQKRRQPDEVINEFLEKMLALEKAALPKLKGRSELDVPYEGGGALDVLGTDLPDGAPILLYIHGGYWQEGDRSLYRGIWEPLLSRGVKAILAGYDLVTKPGVSLTSMSAQLCRAVAFANNYASLHGNSSLYLSGHSAGAHLAAMSVLGSESLSQVKGLFLLSGVFDLGILKDTYIGQPLRGFSLTPEEVTQISPSRRVEELAGRSAGMTVKIVAGEFDTPAFREAAKKMAKALNGQGMTPPAECVILKGEDHFTMIDRLESADFELTKLLLLWMGKGA